jgi:hypothetical protein
MHLEDLLTQAGVDMGLGGLSLNADGLCRLIFSKTIVVDLERADDEPGTALIYSSVGILPPADREALLLLLLEANLFGQGTGRATLAVDPARSEILLFRRFDLERLEYSEFIRDLESFVNLAGSWIERLASTPPNPLRTPAADARDRDGFIPA